MIRRETFCDDRLVKEIDQVDVSTQGGRSYVDGRHIWLLDGEEVQPVEAEAFRIMWEAQGP
ncbi:hypothetical protein WB388_08705 [Streptomyces brasiliscabiei]|uniref:Uncharacterized protein n=1 Tax=Streptomyces brasiliscabiei TaxID=2736302 RepID=A0ABU8GA60_9ACTN